MGNGRAKQARTAPKLAADLEEILAQDDEDLRRETSGQSESEIHEARMARIRKAAENGEDPVVGHRNGNGVALPSRLVSDDLKQSFIVQTNGQADLAFEENLSRLGGRVAQKIDGTNLVAIEIPRVAVRELAASAKVAG